MDTNERITVVINYLNGATTIYQDEIENIIKDLDEIDKDLKEKDKRIEEQDNAIAQQHGEIIELENNPNYGKAQIAELEKANELMAERLDLIDDQDNWELSSMNSILEHYKKKAREEIRGYEEILRLASAVQAEKEKEQSNED